MDQSLQREQLHITEIPAPWVAGLYSIQTHPIDPKALSYTMYRPTAELAVDCVQRCCRSGENKYVFLRQADHVWDVYNAEGTLIHLCSEISLMHKPDVETRGTIDWDALDSKVCTVLKAPRMTRLVSVAGHAGETAAGLANFRCLFTDLMKSASPTDLDQLVLVEDQSHACRNLALYAEVLKLSVPLRDMWLDAYRYVSNNVPLDYAEYMLALSYQLSYARWHDLNDMAQMAMSRVGTGSDDRTYLGFCLQTSDVRRMLADGVVQLLGKFFEPHPDTGIEMLPHQHLVAHAPEVVTMLRDAVQQVHQPETARAK